MKAKADVMKAEIIPLIPFAMDPPEEAIPADIIGATIINFGAAPEECRIEGGGLIIDYLPEGAFKTVRVVLAFTELGMWIEASSARQHTEDKL